MMIKRILSIIVLTTLLYSCVNNIDGNGNVVNEKRKVSSFNKIDISGGYEVFINQGDEERLELEVDENLIEYIETEVKNNTLYISSTESFGRAKSLKLYITVVNLEDIDVSGAIELKNKGTLHAKKLEIDVSGAADINLDVAIKSLNMDLSGASETTLTGSADDFKIEISGAGDLDAKKLKTNNTTIELSGAGSAVVHAKETLRISVSGAGSVKYKGNPEVEKDISGAGSVEKL